jgi:hypothetical protein
MGHQQPNADGLKPSHHRRMVGKVADHRWRFFDNGRQTRRRSLVMIKIYRKYVSDDTITRHQSERHSPQRSGGRVNATLPKPPRESSLKSSGGCYRNSGIHSTSGSQLLGLGWV